MNVVVMKAFFSLIISFLVTFYLVPLLCQLAVKLRFVDEPDGKIKTHAKTTPYMGGVAVYGGFITALALLAPVDGQFFLFLVGSTLLLLVGLVDDLVVMKPYQKFFGQIIATLCFLKAGLYLKEQFFYAHWMIPFSFMWILTIINAFNLVDVMDGLSTTLATSATITFLGLAWYLGQYNLCIILSAFLGPLLAFFWYNRPVAKIYLGDAGSLFIGGFLGAMPFLIPWGTYTPYGYIAPVIIFAIPLLEIMALIIIRTYKGIPFYLGSPDHFSIYLKKKGWTVWQVLAFVAFLSGILITTAFLVVANTISLSATIALGIGFLSIWVAKIFF